MPSSKHRPGVVTLTSLAFLLAGVAGVSTTLYLSFQAITAPSGAVGSISLLSLVSVVDLSVAYGLWHMKAWAWYTGIVTLLIGIPVESVVFSTVHFAFGVFGIVLDLGIVGLIFLGRRHFPLD